MSEHPEATIEQTCRWGAERLARHGCQDARLDAELLLGHVLGWNRIQLYGHPESKLSEREQAAFVELVGRRARREPLAHILGSWEFRGLDLAVSHDVLIPRPETEMLVDLAKGSLLDLRREREHGIAGRPLVVADVGTGSGAIAISIAVEMRDVVVHAIDLSAEALRVAAANCQRHQVGERVTLRKGDLLDGFGRADVIVANLPYIRRNLLPGLEPEVSRFEPALALDGGRDGLDLIARLLAQAPDHIEAGGAIWLEIGADQGKAAQSLAREAFPDARISLQQDYAGRDRIVGIGTRSRD